MKKKVFFFGLFSKNIFQKIKFLVAAAFFFAAFSASADTFWDENLDISSGTFENDGDFDAVGFLFSGDFSAEYWDGERFQKIEIDRDNGGENWSELVFWKRGTPFEMRFSGDFPKTLRAHFQKLDDRDFSASAIAQNAVGGISIVSRRGWGADENWRYDGRHAGADVEEKETGRTAAKLRQKQCTNAKNVFPDEFEIAKIVRTENGKNLIWPYQYSKKIRKIVIHHTAETGAKNGIAEEKVMRGIYHYHAVTRKWGDIGYHFVIGPDGRIFEGRAGGDFVIGGHVFCNNIGTIGISVMGNFETDEPTTAQKNALKRLLPALAKKYELDLTDSEFFHGKKTPNLLGHRDLGPTACPGKNLYGFLPKLRKYLSGTPEIEFAKTFRVDGVPVGAPPILKLKPGRSADITLAFKNTGNATWDGTTWLFGNPGTGVELESASPIGTKYFAARMVERAVPPGKIAHFKVRLKAGFRGGIFTVAFVPIVNDRRVSRAEVLQIIEVAAPDFSGQFSALRLAPKLPATGTPIGIAVAVKNTGKTRWEKEKMRLLLFEKASKKNIFLSLEKNTEPGQIGLFRGQISPFSTAGKKEFLATIFFGRTRTKITFPLSINVFLSENKAKNLDLKKRFQIFSDAVFSKKIRFRNLGTKVWDGQKLRLEVRKGRKFWRFSPTEKEISRGGVATFSVQLPLSTTISPFFFQLKDGRETLFKKLLLTKKVGNKKASPEKLSKNLPKKITKTPPKNPEKIRIKLAFPFEKYAEIRGNFEIFSPTGEKIFSGKSAKILKFGEKVRFQNRVFSFLKISPKSGDLEIAHWERFPAWDLKKTQNDNRFAGDLEIRVFRGKLTIINILPIEKYLAGVAEVPENEPLEKMKSIAVAARSYAKFYADPAHRKFPGAPFDGSDNPAEFQKYLGVNFENRAPKWKKAVAETAGEVLTFDGKIIKAPFHSCSGGKTLSAAEKWGWKNAPYLKSVADPGGVGKPRSGHGVGLSGCGAKYLAEKGKNYREILKYFYDGVEIERK